MTAKIRDIYATDDATFGETHMAICLGRDDAGDTFGLGVHNLVDCTTAFVIVRADELLRLRDAITKELAQ